MRYRRPRYRSLASELLKGRSPKELVEGPNRVLVTVAPPPPDESRPSGPPSAGPSGRAGEPEEQDPGVALGDESEEAAGLVRFGYLRGVSSASIGEAPARGKAKGGESVADYWRGRGVAYSGEEARNVKVAEVALVKGNASFLCSYPSDQV